jgi:hypothetical protein
VASQGRAAREAPARAEPRPTIAVCAAQKGYRQEERETPQILLNFTPFVLVPVGEETDSPNLNAKCRTANPSDVTPIFQPAFGGREGRFCQTVTGVFEKSGHIGSCAPE